MKPTATLKGHSESVNALLLDPSRPLLFSASDVLRPFSSLHGRISSISYFVFILCSNSLTDPLGPSISTLSSWLCFQLHFDLQFFFCLLFFPIVISIAILGLDGARMGTEQWEERSALSWLRR